MVTSHDASQQIQGRVMFMSHTLYLNIIQYAVNVGLCKPI